MALDEAQAETLEFLKPLAQARAREVAETCGKEVDLDIQLGSFKIDSKIKSIFL